MNIKKATPKAGIVSAFSRIHFGVNKTEFFSRPRLEQISQVIWCCTSSFVDSSSELWPPVFRKPRYSQQ